MRKERRAGLPECVIMKIGAFAKKYGLNPSAVRYYVDKALITPKRENGRYVFDRSCMEQLEKIIEYKKMKLSLEEIETLFYYERASNLNDKEVIKLIVSSLQGKIAQIDSEMQELKDIRDSLTSKVIEYKQTCSRQNTVEAGLSFPLEMLDQLECPVCHKKISLSNASVDGKGIKDASVRCDCGYKAVISEGVLLSEGYMQKTPFKAFENINSIEVLEDEFSSSYRSLHLKAYLWMYQKINSYEKPLKYIMAGPFTYNFLPEYLNEMPDDAVYIITDVSLEKVQKLKGILSKTGKRILFIVGDMNRIPLKREIIDLYIDDFSNSNNIFTYNSNIVEFISGLLKPQGCVAGIFADYEKAPNSLANFKRDHPAFDPGLMSIKKIYSDFTGNGIRIKDKNNLGSPQGNEKHFLRQFNDEQIQVVSYFGEKTNK